MGIGDFVVCLNDLVTWCTMVWDWWVLRAGQCLFVDLSSSLPFYLPRFLRSLLFYCGLVLWGWGIDDDDSTLIVVVPSPGVRVTVAESMSRDLVKVSEWSDLWGMKLNASKTKTMIVSRSRTMHVLSPALTIGGTVLKESDNLIILGVTFDSNSTFEKNLRSISRAAFQGLVS